MSNKGEDTPPRTPTVEKDKGKKDPKVKIPEFSGKLDEYDDWKIRVQEWEILEAEYYEYPAVMIKSSLQNEAWRCVKNLTVAELRGKDGIQKLFRKLDEKYKKDRRLEVIKKVMSYYDIEREANETIRDFLERFEKAKEESKRIQEEENEGVVEGWVALYRAKLTDTERKIILGACVEGNQGYNNVKKEMLRIVEKEDDIKLTGEKKSPVWLSSTRGENNPGGLNPCNRFGKRMRCHKCGSLFHFAGTCEEKVEKCWICRSIQHIAEKCPDNWINKKQQKNEEDRKQRKQEKEKNNREGYMPTSIDKDDDMWDRIEAIVDTGCPQTVMGEK